MNERKWYLRTQDETFGPETGDTLVSWAKMGRIQPGQEVSDDNVIWTKVEEVPFLDMRFSIDIGDGNPRGPFNKAAADALIASGRLPAAAKVVETRAPFPAPEPEPEPVVEENPDDGMARTPDAPLPEPVDEQPSEPVVEESVPVVEQPSDDGRARTPDAPLPEPEVKIVEKIVEVPVEKIVEKEVRVEVPVEKIVEKVVTVVDDTRVKELEGMLAEERARVASLQGKFDESSKTASEQRNEIARLEGEIKNGAEREKAMEERIADANAKFEQAARDAVDREMKLNEQISALEDELRRLPQAASEVADIQAAMFGLMAKEAEEINAVLSVEKAEAEEFRKRSEARCDRLLERRREILKMSGANIEEMTRKSLIERPEDPRTAQLRRELDELRRADEKKTLDAMARIRDLESALKERDADSRRIEAEKSDVAQLRGEISQLREQLRSRERELLAERERAEAFRQREAANQQAMIARLKVLESPSIGISSEASSNQHREARKVKISSWLRLGAGDR